MAADDWRAGIDLRSALAAAPERFAPFQLLRLLDLLSARRGGLGATLDPAQEPVRFHGSFSPVFPPSGVERGWLPGHEPPEVADADRVSPQRRMGARRFRDLPGQPPQGHMELAWLSFGGAQGTLPQPLAEHIRQRIAEGDDGAAAFLDLFIHRLALLWWRSRRDLRPDLETRPPEATPAGQVLAAVVGLAPQAARQRQALPDHVLFRLAPLIGRRPLSGEALRRAVSDLVGAPAALTELVGRWIALAESSCTRLGREDGNARLGVTAVLGGRLWVQAGGVDLTLGPLSLALFVTLLPGGRLNTMLRELLLFVLDRPFQVTATLVLDRAERPAMILAAQAPPRLGWTSWLGAADGGDGRGRGDHGQVRLTLITSAQALGGQPRETLP